LIQQEHHWFSTNEIQHPEVETRKTSLHSTASPTTHPSSRLSAITLKANNGGFQCPVCNEAFGYDYQLATHMTQHVPEDGEIRKENSIEAGEDASDYGMSLRQIPLVQPELPDPQPQPSRRRRRTPWLSGRIYKCTEADCRQRFHTYLKMKTHRQRSHNLEPNKLSSSSSKIKTPRLHSEDQSSPCASMKITEIFPLARHFNYIHPTKKVYKCKLCSFSSRFKSSVYRHQRCHRGTQRRIKCSSCDGWFNSERSFKYHLRTAHSSADESRQSSSSYNRLQSDFSSGRNAAVAKGKRIHACAVCKKKFLLILELRRHAWLSHGLKSFTCEYCPLKFTYLSNMKSHIQRLHENDRTTEHQCQACGAKCHSNSGLTRHIAQVHENSLICGSATQMPLEINATTSNINGEKWEGKRKCPETECPYEATLNHQVLRHMRLAHTQVKRKYKCTKCSASYKVKTHFIHHKELHKMISETDVVKPNFLQKCNAQPQTSRKSVRAITPDTTFPRISPASKDENEKESGQGWYCDVCDKKCPTRWDLTNHQKSQYHIYNAEILRCIGHGQEIPTKPSGTGVQCGVCGMMFKARVNLQLHQEIKHGRTARRIDNSSRPTRWNEQKTVRYEKS